MSIVKKMRDREERERKYRNRIHQYDSDSHGSDAWASENGVGPYF